MNVGSRVLSEEQIEELREAFGLFDKDHDGHITMQELRSMMKLFNRPCTADEAREIMAEVDKNNDGVIDFREFVELMSPVMSPNRADDADLKAAFDFFDKDHDGDITIRELKAVLQSLHLKLTDSEIEEMITEADTDRSGTVSFDEFKSIMSKRKR
ncbi:calmodulin-A [Paragonimus heterotremus]|uniref:Calmodulin-A n=1 Tax=Paragonimus heterotremus TaxID=100268 RepID=A0A8J4TCQ9_9TREM|nr:calmodulin-A [Paragonimus heterotremus]